MLLVGCGSAPTHTTDAPASPPIVRCADGAVPAFPGAEGFAACVTGGRGGQVIHVTNLDAAGAGSLQAALEATGARTIVFDVSGVIPAAGYIRHPDVTIAGQTSPNGIIVRGISCDGTYEHDDCSNVILRHLRSRPGIAGPGSSPLDDAIRVDGAHDIMIDHLSLGSATDESFQLSRSSNITVQNTILAEPIGDHANLGGLLVNYSLVRAPLANLSIHHNLWSRVGGRLPELSCEENGADQGLASNCTGHRTAIELSNNVLWDGGIETYYNRCTGNNEGNDCAVAGPSQYLDLNWVGNVMIRRSSLRPRDMPMLHDAIGNTPQNIVFSADNRLGYGSEPPVVSDPTGQSAPARLGFPAITTHSSAELMAYVTATCGAFPRDPMDRRLLGYLSQNVDNTPSAQEANNGIDFGDAYAVDTTRTLPLDTDRDGIPDVWERARGLDPVVPSNNGTELSASYTNLEVYLNELSDSLVAP